MKDAKFLQLGWKDVLKGMIVAVLTAVVTVLYTTIQSGGLSFDWALIGKTAAIAALSYLLKNVFTNSEDQFMKKEP